MKLGIIRCMQAEAYRPESRDFRTIRERKGAFPPAYGKIDFTEKC